MFEVQLKKNSEKFLFQINEKVRAKIIEILRTLEINPIPFRQYDVRKLKGFENRFRIRKGKIRIVYEVLPEEFKVIVWDINFRGRVYKP
jgi:mRNA interferase RelE/StbE